MSSAMDSQDVSEGNSDLLSVAEEVMVGNQHKDQMTAINRKNNSTLKEENDKLRTYLGLVKMCNNSAINKIKSAINETMSSLNSPNDCTIDSTVIVRQLEIIQNEIQNMQTIHSHLDEGIEAFTVIDSKGTEDRDKEPVVVVTTRYEVPRKSTGIRKTTKTRIPYKPKITKDSTLNVKLLDRIVDTNRQTKGLTAFVDNIHTPVCSEEQEAVANIDNMSSGEERENESQDVNDLNEYKQTVITKVRSKKPYISEEFKSSHLQRLVEAKRRREEMNRQLEREGKRKPKPRRMEDRMRDLTEFDRKSTKKRNIKKKTIGKVIRKKIQNQSITTPIVLPLNQALDTLSGQTIQIIASGGTQILCRNDGTFIPASNSTQWTTTNAQWTTTDGTNSFTQNQWNQYQT